MNHILAFIFLQVTKHEGFGFFGPYDPYVFLSALGFAVLGHLLVTFFDVSTRNVHKPGTPVVFSWPTLLSCNWKRFVRNIILIYLAVRFCPEITGWQLGDWSGALVGGSIDAIFVAYKKARFSSKNRS